MLRRLALVGLALCLVAALMTFAGCPPKAEPTTSVSPLPTATTDGSQPVSPSQVVSGDLPTYSATVSPPTAAPSPARPMLWRTPNEKGVLQAPWKEMPKHVYEVPSALTLDLEATSSFAITVRPESLDKTLWIQTDDGVKRLSEWPHRVDLKNEEGKVQYPVYVFKARSMDSPSWVTLGVRDAKGKYLGKLTQIAQCGTLTDWESKSTETLSGGHVLLYGMVTFLHGDTPGSVADDGPWAWYREVFDPATTEWNAPQPPGEKVKNPKTQGGLPKEVATPPKKEWNEPQRYGTGDREKDLETKSGLLPKEATSPPWGGDWPAPFAIAFPVAGFENDDWKPGQASPSATQTPSTEAASTPTVAEVPAPTPAASEAQSVDVSPNRKSARGEMTWSSDDLERPGHHKKIGADIPNAPRWCVKGTKFIITKVE